MDIMRSSPTIRAITCSFVCLSFSMHGAADTHPKVKVALNWQLPENTCKQPRELLKSEITDKNGVTRSYDVDGYSLDRQKRKKKRWQKCVTNYKSGLHKAFSKLKASAQYGLTQPEATTILNHMASIQAVIVSPTGSSVIDKTKQ